MSISPSSPPFSRAASAPDYWDRFPVVLLGYGRALAEVALPVAPRLLTPLSAVTMAYVSLSSIDRGIKASKLSPHPELRRYDGFAAAFESGFLGWVSLITLPSFALGLVAGPAAAFVQARSATLSASAVRFGPAALGAALLPLVLPACAAGARAAHEWAVLPVIESNRPPVEADGAYTPGAAYQTPTSEEVLVGLEALPSLDPADRARLRWALDGDPASQYPTETAAAAHAATPEEDAALRASLRDYTARVEAAVAARAAPAAGGERESDFDALVVAVVNAASTQGRGPGGAPQAQGGGAALK